MACNWLITMSSHCPNLVRIGCNAYFLSHFTVYGVQLDPIGIAFNENVLINYSWSFHPVDIADTVGIILQKPELFSELCSLSLSKLLLNLYSLVFKSTACFPDS